MICYRDRTYCASDCVRFECSRFVSKEVEDGAKRFDLPLALTDFSKNCPDYMPVPVFLKKIKQEA